MKESQEFRLYIPFSTVIALDISEGRVRRYALLSSCERVTVVGRWKGGSGSDTVVGEIYNRKALKLGVVREFFCRNV